MNEKERRRMCNGIPNFNSLPSGKQAWLVEVARRLQWVAEDIRAYIALDKSYKDRTFFENLNLKYDQSYYVVSNKQEFLEKFRVYLISTIYDRRRGGISFTNKVTLKDYLRVVEEPEFNLSNLTLDNKRLLVYCHRHNNFTANQEDWVQGNLFCSDICDRLLTGEKLLILAEYNVKELDNILSHTRLTKIVINDNDLTTHGFYTANIVDSAKKPKEEKTATGENFG